MIAKRSPKLLGRRPGKASLIGYSPGIAFMSMMDVVRSKKGITRDAIMNNSDAETVMLNAGWVQKSICDS